ncbi:MAG: hypothetical protein Q8O66_02575 [bacterium]|nr:hypothetical protein [bacterium]
MNKFFRPSFFKIAITIILLIIVFGGGLLYGFTLTITKNGVIEQTSLSIKIIKIIGDVIYYPVRVVLTPFNNNFEITLTNNINDPYILFNPYILFVSIMSILLATLESYLISCGISILINNIIIKKI